MSVSVTYKFSCGGCNAEAIGKPQAVRQVFRSLSGRGHGFGSYHIDTPSPDAPEGWVPFDPYTGCCYCPDCWASIVEDLSKGTPEHQDSNVMGVEDE